MKLFIFIFIFTISILANNKDVELLKRYLGNDMALTNKSINKHSKDIYLLTAHEIFKEIDYRKKSSKENRTLFNDYLELLYNSASKNKNIISSLYGIETLFGYLKGNPKYLKKYLASFASILYQHKLLIGYLYFGMTIENGYSAKGIQDPLGALKIYKSAIKLLKDIKYKEKQIKWVEFSIRKRAADIQFNFLRSKR